MTPYKICYIILCHAERTRKNNTFLPEFFFFNISTYSHCTDTPTKWYVKKSRLVYKHAPKPVYITIISKLGGHTTSRYNTNPSISICGPVGSTSVRESSTRQKFKASLSRLSSFVSDRSAGGCFDGEHLEFAHRTVMESGENSDSRGSLYPARGAKRAAEKRCPCVKRSCH